MRRSETRDQCLPGGGRPGIGQGSTKSNGATRAIRSKSRRLSVTRTRPVSRHDSASKTSLPKDFETRVGFDLATSALGAGAMGPIQLLADFGTRPVDPGAVERYAATVKGLPDVRAVAAPVISRDGRKALMIAIGPAGLP